MDVEAGEQHHGPVALVLELPALGRAGDGGLGRVDPGLWPGWRSSRRPTTPLAFCGGLRYRPHTSAAFSQKSGSWLVIHDSTCQGFRSKALQIRQHCDAEIGTPWAAMASANASIVHRVASSGGVFGHRLHQQQHVIVVVDARPTWALLVIEAGRGRTRRNAYATDPTWL